MNRGRGQTPNRSPRQPHGEGATPLRTGKVRGHSQELHPVNAISGGRHRQNAADAVDRLVAATRARSIAVVIEELVDRMNLSLSRPATWAVVGGEGAHARGRMLSAVAAHPTGSLKRIVPRLACTGSFRVPA